MSVRAGWLLLVVCATAVPLGAAPSIVEALGDGVYVVRDDQDSWGGMVMGITHMNAPEYQARKTLDLSDLPEDTWAQVREVRLSAYFMVRDYSWHDRPEADGLDEAYEFIVNGVVHQYPTGGGAPVFKEGGAPTIAWYDMEIPKDELRRGANEIVVHKAQGGDNDDYLYLGIDNSIRRGNSKVALDGQTWTSDQLNVPGGKGEYMVRLYLICKDMSCSAQWQPSADPPLSDPHSLVVYAGAHGAARAADGVRIDAGHPARIEWYPQALDRLRPVTAEVTASDPVQIEWLDDSGKPLPNTAAQAARLELPASRTFDVSGLIVHPAGDAATIQEVRIAGTVACHPIADAIDLCPEVSPPAGQPAADATPTCRMEGSVATLENAGLVSRFRTDGHLRLESLYNRITDSEMVRDPEAVSLFLVEVSDRRYAGSRDFTCDSVEAADGGFTSRLSLGDPAIAATLTATMAEEGLRLGLRVANSGTAPVDLKVAFPHLAGLAVSGNAADDYYFFPRGGGIIGDRPALIRAGYGDHEALYQVMDLFSPSRGGGLAIRADDPDGWHKVLSLHKLVPGKGQTDDVRLGMQVREEYRWQDPFEQVPGTSLCYEYLRRTRNPGEGFEPAPAVLWAHAGDWRVPFRTYADWAHRVWHFRPYPSALGPVRHMIATGWGQDVLFRDGHYRTDFIRPETDCIELMSWWDWSPLGPWSTPFDRLSEVLDAATLEAWKPYFVTDPVTGQMMWNNQPGGYDGYNERFGGLPAFHDAIKTYRNMGALVTLYTDPFRMDDASKIGKAHGREWCVIGMDGKPSKGYEVWNPCYDLPEARQWIADTMGRVMRETGADGIRLDECGHTGWACYSTEHHHTFAEPGVTQWQKAVAETARMVRAEMDAVDPKLVLTTEHPGYDYLMQHLDGCITYDLTVQASPLRPLPCNLQRFYFPECKAYELDHRGADPGDKVKFWNAVASFGRYYPPACYAALRENADAYGGPDCEPLIRTPGQALRVYVNRFRADGKTIYHLHNATGHTFEGMALAVACGDDEHVVDLLAGTEVPLGPGHAGVRPVVVYLPRGETACIAQLPQRLAVERDAGGLVVRTGATDTGLEIALCDAEGKRLLLAPADDTPTRWDLTALPQGAAPACVKLLRNGLLVDLAGLPAEG